MMPRTFRLTCARTTYFEVELAAGSAVEAELMLERALAGDPKLCERSPRLGRSTHRVVEVEEASAREMVTEKAAETLAGAAA
jgi:hypothetical protein